MVAESETDLPIAVSREDFLSLRSLTYVNNLLNGEREIDRGSVSYTQLSQEVNAALADFACLAIVEELDLLQLWAAGSREHFNRGEMIEAYIQTPASENGGEEAVAVYSRDPVQDARVFIDPGPHRLYRGCRVRCRVRYCDDNFLKALAVYRID